MGLMNRPQKFPSGLTRSVTDWVVGWGGVVCERSPVVDGLGWIHRALDSNPNPDGRTDWGAPRSRGMCTQ